LTLAAGSTWQPRKILRVIEQFTTSTRTVKVETDEGIGFIKGLGNPSGPDSLACELIAGELASAFGLRTPEFAIVEVGALSIPMLGVGDMLRGPAFISRELSGETSDGSQVFLNRLDDPSVAAMLVVFDTLIRNHDRCPPDDGFDEPNRDNLFFTPKGRKFEMVAFDHSHCFIDTALEDIAGGLANLVAEERVFGLFPEFRPHLSEPAVLAAIARLDLIQEPLVSEALASIPPAWGVIGTTKDAWATLILERARRLPHFLVGKILPQHRLGFEEEE
jgi:hypothetical protein